MRCTEFEELAGAYVLDAITPEEREEAEAHLAHCAACRRFVADLYAVVDQLADSVPQVEPSPELKERMLSAIRGRARPAAHLRQGVSPSPPQRRRLGWQHWRTHLLAATCVLELLLLGAMGVWNISLQQQIAAAQQKIATLAPVIYSIRGISPTSNVTGQLIYYPQQQISVLVMHGLPHLEGVHVYQGWLLQGKQPTSMGVLNSKQGVATVDFLGNVKGFDAAAVSLEPGPGESVPAPKGAVIAVGRLNSPAPPAQSLISNGRFISLYSCRDIAV